VAVFIVSYAMTPFVYAQTAAGDPLVAKVGNIEIHESDLAMAAEDVGQNNPGKDDAAKQAYLVNYVSDMILLANAAEANRLMDDAEVRRRVQFSRNKTLMERMLAHTAADAVSEDSVRKAYDDATRQISNEMEVHARHILFKVADSKDAAISATAEARAKAAVQRVRNGEEYLAVAKDLSGDPAGNQSENDLGYFAKTQMMPEVAEAAFRLEPGHVSDPVKSAFGWHVLFVVEKRVREAPEFDKVRPQLQTYVMRKAQIDLVNKLRAAAPVERVSGSSPADANK
jgi:peptidyl-prolyl cis-trans isomerase C